MKRSKTRLKIRQSYWFIPSLFGVISFLIAIFVIKIDFSFSKKQLQHFVPNLVISDTKLGITLLSTMVQSILTMMTISFSTIMVVLTTFSGQFSPRTLQNFISDRKTQYVIAIFSGGVVYNLFTLLVMKPTNHGSLLFTPIFSVLYGLLCVAAFVYFINHVAKWVQVNHLIDKLTNEAFETIDRVYKEAEKYQHETTPDDKIDTEGKEHFITAENSGYLQLVDLQHLIRQAEKDDVTIRFQVFVGDYVIRGTPLFSYWRQLESSKIDESQYRWSVKLGAERTSVQDIELGIQKLVEIALRAISPAVNDPHTAINCINRIGSILLELSQKQIYSFCLHDRDQVARVEIKHHDFSHYLYKGFYQIRHYGREDVSVTTAILRVLGLIAETAPESVRKQIFEFGNYIFDGFDQSVLLDKDKDYIEKERLRLSHIASPGRNREGRNGNGQ